MPVYLGAVKLDPSVSVHRIIESVQSVLATITFELVQLYPIPINWINKERKSFVFGCKGLGGGMTTAKMLMQLTIMFFSGIDRQWKTRILS